MTREEQAEVVMASLAGLEPCWHCGTYTKGKPVAHTHRAWRWLGMQHERAFLCTRCKHLKAECHHCKGSFKLKTLLWFDYNGGLGVRKIVACCGYCRRQHRTWANHRIRIYGASPSAVPLKQETIH